MKKDVEQHLEIYEENKRYGNTGIIVITKDYEQNTATSSSDMNATHLINSLSTVLSNKLEHIGQADDTGRQYVQDAIMTLLHDSGLVFSDEFTEALPKHKDFPILSPTTAIVEPTSDIMARLSK